MSFSPDSFVSNEDRDAYAVIRGFNYQIQLSILRLLSLGPGEALELERGEDIDILAKAFIRGQGPNNDGVAWTRLLEQVKHRAAKSVTLQTDSAREALANFHGHRKENPGLNLRFRYTTNSVPGRERKSPFEKGILAIDLWEQIRHDPTTVTTERLEGIRSILESLKRPKDYSEEPWKEWRDFITDVPAEDLLSFIMGFEWGTGQTHFEEIDYQVRRELMARGLAASENEASVLHDKLTVRVLRLLSKPRLKTLRFEDLTGFASAPELDADEQSILTSLRYALFDIEALGRRLNTNPNLQTHVSTSWNPSGSLITTHISAVPASPEGILQIDLSRLPDTPERQALAAALNQAQARGEEVQVSGPQFAELLPEPLRAALLQAMQLTGNQDLTVTPLPGPPVNFPPDPSIQQDFYGRIDFIPDVGERFTLNVVNFRLVRRGTERVVIASERPHGLPIEISFSENFTSSPRWQFELKSLEIPDPIDVRTYEQYLQLKTALSKPFAVRLEDLESGGTRGLNFPQSPPITPEPPDDELVAIGTLAEVSRRSGTPIMLPIRGWTSDERNAVAILHSIVTQGGYVVPSSGQQIAVSVAQAKHMVSIIEEEGVVGVDGPNIHLLTLFGTQLPPQPVRTMGYATLPDGTLLGELKHKLEEMSADQQVSLTIVPIQPGSLVVQHPGWKQN
jgi:hypothetical protein